MTYMRVCLSSLLFLLMIFSMGHVFAEGSQLELKPMSEQERSEGLKKMENDLAKFSEKTSMPVAITFVLGGLALMVIGSIFSKKLVASGLAAVGMAITWLTITGDLKGFMVMLKELSDVVRSWWK